MVLVGQPGAVVARGVVPASALLRDSYLAELRELGRADGTLIDLAVILGSFVAAVPRLDAEAAAVQTQTWLRGLRGSGLGRGDGELSAARRNKYLVNARALVRWAMQRHDGLADCTRGLRAASVEARLKPQFTVDECGTLLGGRPSRTRCWVALMLLAGLRSDEARRIRWGDVDAAGGVLLVRLASGAQVKRRKERIVPIQPGLLAILGDFGPSDQPIAGLGAGNLVRAFADYLSARKLPHGARTPHSCRHTYAGLMTATGLPTALLGAYLGHSSAQTTMAYTALAARYAQDHRVLTWPRGVLRLGGGAS